MDCNRNEVEYLLFLEYNLFNYMIYIDNNYLILYTIIVLVEDFQHATSNPAPTSQYAS